MVALGYLGSKPPEGAYVFWARVFTVYYFVHFLVVMPIVGVIGDARRRCRDRSAEAVLGKSGQARASGGAGGAGTALARGSCTC